MCCRIGWDLGLLTHMKLTLFRFGSLQHDAVDRPPVQADTRVGAERRARHVRRDCVDRPDTAAGLRLRLHAQAVRRPQGHAEAQGRQNWREVDHGECMVLPVHDESPNYRLWMWRWSHFGLRELCDKFKTGFAYQQWKWDYPEMKSLKRKKKKHLSDCMIGLDARKSLVVSISHKKNWRADTLQPGLEFDNSKPRLKSVIFICISWLNGSFFFFWGKSWFLK